jgi:excinuclease ABC subunit A
VRRFSTYFLNAIILMASKTKPYKKIEGLDLIDKVINIDQSPIGNTTFNPATYTEVFTEGNYSP